MTTLNSPIEWTDRTWGPTVGCTRVSAGCDHCYAFALHDRRHEAWKAGNFPTAPVQYHEPFSKVQLMPNRLGDPLRWRKPQRVFVDSMADLFHADVPDDFILKVFTVMAQPIAGRDRLRHTYQVLTKRPQRMASFLDRLRWRWGTRDGGPWGMLETGGRLLNPIAVLDQDGDAEPAPNIWLGVSIENNDVAWRVDFLRKTPAAVRFVSAEPLIGPIDRLDLTGIDWLITGGESGHGHRPIDPDWVRDVRDRCQAAGVSFFHKQWGGRTSKSGGRLLDGREWNQFPRSAQAATEMPE